MGERPALLDCIESEAKIETIKFLIENGADVNIKNKFGDSRVLDDSDLESLKGYFEFETQAS